MANFTKKTWTTSDSVSATDLNRIENGIQELIDAIESLSAQGDSLVQSGLAKFYDSGIASGGKFTLSVSFARAFKSGTSPIITVTPRTAIPQKTHLGVSSRSSTGFTITLYCEADTASNPRTELGVDWIAVGRSPDAD